MPPVGMQVLGGLWQDEKTLRVARHFQLEEDSIQHLREFVRAGKIRIRRSPFMEVSDGIPVRLYT